MKKLLYISCHETLEYDELRIFTELGYEVFSVGYWMNPHEPKTTIRPAIPQMKVNHELIAKFEKDYPDYKLPRAEVQTGRVRLQKDFLDNFDVVVNCWYQSNLEACLLNSSLPIIHRTIDIIHESIEETHTALYIRRRPFYMVRMSEAENRYAKIKPQAIITQCVNKDDFKGWVGDEKKVFTTIKGFDNRPDTSLPLYNSTTELFDRVLVGLDNKSVGDNSWVKQGIPQDEMLKLMQSCRVNYVQPRIGAAMVYGFIEGMMAGCPVVTYGQKYNGIHWTANQYIKNGINGFLCNSTEDAVSKIQLLMDDYDLAKEISVKARDTAIKNFDYETIKGQWAKLFKEIGSV